MIKTVKVSEKGQIAIPRSIREHAGITKGTELLIFEEKGRILLEKSERIIPFLETELKNIHKLSSKSLEEIWNNKEDESRSKFLRNKTR